MSTAYDSSHHDPAASLGPAERPAVGRASTEQHLHPFLRPKYRQLPQTAVYPSGDGEERVSCHSLGTDAGSVEKTAAPSKLGTSRWHRFSKLFAFEQHHWSLELAAIGLSISSLAAIIILLTLYDTKPLVSWTWTVSFNAVISTLSATSRATLAFAISACISQGKWNWYRTRNEQVVAFDRFEEASRGPWGSLRLLWWTRLRHWIALGALSAVTLVGFEPFLQAVIRFPGGAQPSPSIVSSIGRTLRLDTGKFSKDERSPLPVELPHSPPNIQARSMTVDYDYGAVAAIWEGFSDLATADMLKPSYGCPTGNCSWDAFASLAVCSACSDVSGFITTSRGKTEIGDATYLTSPWVNHTSAFVSGFADYTKYELQWHNLTLSNVDGKERYSHNVELVARMTNNPGETISFQDLKTLIMSYAVMESSQRFRQEEQTWSESTVSAQECALYYCTNIYRSVVELGVLSEAVLGSHSNRNPDSFQYEYWRDELRGYDQVINYTLYTGKKDLYRSDLQLTISKDEYFAATQSNTSDDGLRFDISQNTTASLASCFFNEFWEPEHQLFYTKDQKERPAIMAVLGPSKNITRTFENVAASLTKWMRNRSLRDEPFRGVANEWVVRIQVNWEYLSLPIGALVAGCVFCVLSMLETRRLRLPAWRGSSLATLAYGLDPESRALLRDGGEMTQLDDRARAVEVKFVDSEKGPQLVQGKQATC